MFYLMNYRGEVKRRNMATIINDLRAEGTLDGMDVHVFNMEVEKRMEQLRQSS